MKGDDIIFPGEFIHLKIEMNSHLSFQLHLSLFQPVFQFNILQPNLKDNITTQIRHRIVFIDYMYITNIDIFQKLSLTVHLTNQPSLRFAINNGKIIVITDT